MADGSGIKRKRAQNWTEAEKDFLVETIREKVDIIEEKKCDTHSAKRKAAAWKVVFTAFGAKYGNSRSLQQLKDQWHRIKVNAKKDISAYKKAQFKDTGGGPPPPPPKALSEVVQQMIPAEFEELVNPFDDDAPKSVSTVDDDSQSDVDEESQTVDDSGNETFR